MVDRLAGKVALVTGSTTGIGRATAKVFAEEGARVVVNGRDRARGEETVEHITSEGGEATFFRADVTQEKELRDLIQYAVDTYGQLDILMNNAYSGRSASVTDMTAQDWDNAFAVTVRAAALSSKYAIPHMIEAGGGVIINVASVHGFLADRHNAAYNTFKAGLINLTRQMAVDYGRDGIRVNALCPGRIVTERKIDFLEANPREYLIQQTIYPLGRPGTMREAAKAALFLASDDASFVTGHALLVDGGLTAQLQHAVAEMMHEALTEE